MPVTPEVAARRQRVLTWTIGGASLRQIAQQEKVSHTQAARDRKAALTELARDLQEEALLDGALLAAQYRQMMNRILVRALGSGEGATGTVNLEAVDRWLRAAVQYAKLLGLDRSPELTWDFRNIGALFQEIEEDAVDVGTGVTGNDALPQAAERTAPGVTEPG